MSEEAKLVPDQESEKDLLQKAYAEQLMSVYGLTVGEAEELERGLREENRTAALLMRVVGWQHDTAVQDCCILHETRDIHRSQGEVRAYKNVSRIGDGIRGLLSKLYMK